MIIQHLKMDLNNNMNHMCISDTDPSSAILSILSFLESEMCPCVRLILTIHNITF